MKNEIDYFNGLTNEVLNQRFIKQLYAKTEFIQYNDPDDFFDPEQEYGKHITQCIANESAFLRETITKAAAKNGISLTDEQIQAIFQKKRVELNIVVNPLVNEYIEKISVTYIDPVQSECAHKYLLGRWLCQIWKFLRSPIR